MAGLYYVGRPWQRNRASGLVLGVNDDAGLPLRRPWDCEDANLQVKMRWNRISQKKTRRGNHLEPWSLGQDFLRRWRA